MNKVSICTTLPVYNNEPPFHPDFHYPELKFNETSSLSNFPYKSIRDLFFNLGFDKQNYGTPHWNPLSELINPGETIVIKPNFVLSYHPQNKNVFSIITHPSILRAIIDYCYLALNGKGKIIIADAPQMDCSWNDLMAIQKLDSVISFYKIKFNFDIQIYDLRNFELIDNRKKAYSENRKKLDGDPLGSIIINLGTDSEFYGIPNSNFYGADLNRDETISHHNGQTQEYSISKTILNADLVISVPKMKVHKKVGVTLNLKGLVGINTNKNYLVHFRIGTPTNHGDQLPDNRSRYDRTFIKLQRYLYDKFLAKMTRKNDKIYKFALFIYNKLIKPIKKVSDETIDLDGGNWFGNDTAWRMTSDLAKIFYFADKNGVMHTSIQRKMFSIVDGIIAGENKGPLSPDEKYTGCLVAGNDLFAVDLVTTRLIGFDYTKIRQFDVRYNKKFNFKIKDVGQIELNINDQKISASKFFKKDYLNCCYYFKPHPGWKNEIEL